MNRILAVIICFHPNHERLQRLIDAIRPSVGGIVLFDNGGTDASRLVGVGADVRVQSCGGNVGLAKALNAACEHGVKHGYRLLVSFDQDSTPPVDMIPVLERELIAFQAREPRAIAIGPQLVDLRGGRELVSPFVRFGRVGVSKWSGTGTEPVSQLITSGCMIDLRAWNDGSRFNDALFIDYVDNDWCWRMVRQGHVILGTGRIRMSHEISEQIKASSYISLNKYGPFRRYFQMRNGVYQLLHEPLSFAQRLYVLRAMVIVLCSSMASDESPSRSVWQCLRGATHGLLKRLGPFKT